MRGTCWLMVFMVCLLPASTGLQAQIAVDENLPDYTAVEGVSGTLEQRGVGHAGQPDGNLG